MAIIGAGPYGLSLAAHLRAAGIGFRIFGKTMEPWKRGMPEGMLLKSHPWSACLSDPQGKLTVAAFCADRGIDYHDSRMDLALQTFVDYGEAFQRRFAPDVAPKTLVDLSPSEGGFKARFDDGEVVEARRVVLAVGVHPFKYVPPILAGLPSNMLTHSGDHGALDGFAGKDVVVVGGGASAIDLTALLHERGASVSMVARAPALKFAPPARDRAWWRQLARPNNGLGAGWYLWACANAPELFHALPGRLRRRLVRNTLGPLGGAAMKDRVLGRATLHLGCELVGAEQVGDRIRLAIRRADGAPGDLEADHVIAATGYRIDLNRLGFITPRLRQGIRLADGAPVLTAAYETSMRGLHVIGPASALSFGPVARFVYGAQHPARRLAARFAAEAPRRAPLARPEPLPDVARNA